MKKTIFLLSFSLFLSFISCGPAAEDRKMMHERAKVFQDSIANIIRTSMAEAEGNANTTMSVPAPTASPAATPSTPTK